MGIILDLDQTLIDSRGAEALRRARNWPRVYQTIPDLRPYDGIPELLQELGRLRVPICIVTSSPSSYCSRVLAHWNWNIPATVCYHDTTQRKPHPAPIFKALQLMGVPATAAVSVGDHPNDIVASKAAGVYAVAATWGAADKRALLAAQPDAVCSTVRELRDLLAEWV